MKKYVAAILILLSACKKDPGIDMTPINANGEVLFISRRISNSSDWQMFLMNVDGTNQRSLSDNLVQCSPPTLSHNGKKVAFTAYDNNFRSNLFVIDINGQNQLLLATGKQYCGSPVWSYNDDRIAFVKNNDNGTNDIFSIKADGTDEIKLTNQNNNFSPQYSPDNKYIFFSSSNDNWTGIYKMNPDGSNKVLLTPQNKSFGDPTISPKGNKIAITSNDWNGSQIFVMNTDGSNLKQLTFTTSPQSYPGWPRDGNNNPVWSPDGSKLAYVSFENKSPDIFTIYSDGTRNKRLTDTPLRDENPYWTKDGNYIIFSSNRNTSVSSEIYIMRTEGQLQTALTNFTGDDIFPSFISQ